MVVTITRSGYIKRTHVEAYRSQKRGGKGVTGMETKEEDIVADLFVASTHSYLLFFTNKGKVHWLKVHEIPEGGRQAKGKAMVNVLSLAEGEAVATCVPVRDFESAAYILLATKRGKVKKTELVAFSHPKRGRHPGHHARGRRRGDGGAAHRRPARGAALDQGGHDHPLRRGRDPVHGADGRRGEGHRPRGARPGHRRRGGRGGR